MTWKYEVHPEIDLTRGLDQRSKFDQSLWLRGQEQSLTAATILKHLEDYPGIILGDEVGMGKTWIALLAAIPVGLKKNVLILTPSRVLEDQWLKQYFDLIKQKFCGKDDAELDGLICAYEDFTDLIQDAKKKKRGIYMCSIGQVDPEKSYRSLAEVNGLFELLILDEGHNFKNEFTKRYQIFKTTREDGAFKQPLHGQANRILILTATPFQLGHQELRGVLSIFESTCAGPELIERFRGDLSQSIRVLDSYKELLSKFEYCFKALSRGAYSDFCQAVKQGGTVRLESETSQELKPILQLFDQLKRLKTEVNQSLLKFLIRNLKSKENRKEVPMPLTLPPEKQLLFFLTEQMGKVKRRVARDTDGHMAAVESSFARFDDHLASLKNIDHTLLNHYKRLSEDLYCQYYKQEAHPKLDEIVDEVFESWRLGEKSLVFCFYTKTVDELAKRLEQKVKTYIEGQKHTLEKRVGPAASKEIQVFRDNIGIASNLGSLVFRDNLFAVSLMPILQSNGIDVSKILYASESEQDEIVRYLRDIKFNPKNANFQKIIAAFTFHAFLKFKKLHSKLIPHNLVDDFDYILDPGSLKAIFKRKDTRLREEQEIEVQDLSKDLLVSYVSKLCADQKRLLGILTHPTIWHAHRKELEDLDVEIRVHITEIIGAYLTSDEHLYLALLPLFDARPNVESIPGVYKDSKAAMGESTYARVCRFLNTAAEMAPENVEKLAEEMHFRYSRYKFNSEKIIVETVTGDVNYEAKIRLVTAFRTPLPPYILVSTAVLAEGVDLHTECRHVIHYDHEWNPATLEQKTGRIDRVGSKAERCSMPIEIKYPYIRHTQDEKAYRVVMARKSWFGSVMGERYDSKWNLEDVGEDCINPLPMEVSEALQMKLDNEAHQRKKDE